MNNVLLFVLSCQLLQQMFVFAQNECDCVYGTICPDGTTGGIDIRVVTPDTSCPTGYTYCCVIDDDDDDDDNSIPCGLRRISSQSPGPGLAAYGAYPWMVAILTVQGTYIGGGVLISSRRVLTVAHKVAQFDNSDIIARLGEWSFESENGQSINIGISEISVISTFNSQNLHNDIAVLKLSSPAPIASNGNINTACLSTTSVTPGTKCWMSGWGKDAFNNGQLQPTLKQVDLRVLSKADCQAALRRTRLGRNFVLHNSFMCAGAGQNKDACTGDGGSPLVCPTSNDQYVVVGLVSWGIGCGDEGVPGVYTDVLSFYNWIMQQ